MIRYSFSVKKKRLFYVYLLISTPISPISTTCIKNFLITLRSSIPCKQNKVKFDSGLDFETGPHWTYRKES